MQKTLIATERYVLFLKCKGHAVCYKCKKEFKKGQKLHGSIQSSGGGKSKFFHNTCYEDSLY